MKENSQGTKRDMEIKRKRIVKNNGAINERSGQRLKAINFSWLLALRLINIILERG